MNDTVEEKEQTETEAPSNNHQVDLLNIQHQLMSLNAKLNILREQRNNALDSQLDQSVNVSLLTMKVNNLLTELTRANDRVNGLEKAVAKKDMQLKALNANLEETKLDLQKVNTTAASKSVTEETTSVISESDYKQLNVSYSIVCNLTLSLLDHIASKENEASIQVKKLRHLARNYGDSKHRSVLEEYINSQLG